MFFISAENIRGKLVAGFWFLFVLPTWNSCQSHFERKLKEHWNLFIYFIYSPPFWPPSRVPQFCLAKSQGHITFWPSLLGCSLVAASHPTPGQPPRGTDGEMSSAVCPLFKLCRSWEESAEHDHAGKCRRFIILASLSQFRRWELLFNSLRQSYQQKIVRLKQSLKSEKICISHV